MLTSKPDNMAATITSDFAFTKKPGRLNPSTYLNSNNYENLLVNFSMIIQLR